jgi:hypothetical protein
MLQKKQNGPSVYHKNLIVSSLKPGTQINIGEIHFLSRRDQSASPLEMPADFSVWEHNRCLLLEPYEAHKYTVLARCRVSSYNGISNRCALREERAKL